MTCDPLGKRLRKEDRMRPPQSLPALAAAAVIALSGPMIANSAQASSALTAQSTVAVSGHAVADSTGIKALKTKRVGGGTWEYGTTGPNGGGIVYSNYYHSKKTHGSSVRNAKGKVVRSKNIKKNQWSNAQTDAVAGKVDRAYWRVIN